LKEGLTDTTIYFLAANASVVVAGTMTGVFRSTDNGLHWTEGNAGLLSHWVFALAAAGDNFFAATSSGLYVSTTGGTTWTSVMSGTTMYYVQAIGTDGTYLYSGTRHSGVWWRPLSEMLTSVGPLAGGLPEEFRLMQNYPNPFNPETTIEYKIGGARGQGSGASHVQLIVYDLLGRTVSTLVNEKKAPGTYTVRFDATGLGSGVYFCQMTAGTFVETKKLLLLR
jgi:hypothetical protein